MSDELYTLEQCAEKVDMSVSTIKREIAAGRLTPTRIRAGVRIHPRDWEEYLQKCRSASTAAATKLGLDASARRSAELSAAVAMLPNLSAALSKGSKIAALDDYRNTRSRKRSTAG